MKKYIIAYMVMLSVLVAVLLSVGTQLLLALDCYCVQTVMGCMLIVLLIAICVANNFSKKIIAPIQTMNFTQPMSVPQYEELRPVLQYVAQQRVQIDEKIAKLNEKQREFTILTENMNEGLLVLNNQGCILSINPCAARILGLQDTNDVAEKHITMTEQYIPLQKIVEESLNGHYCDSLIALDGRIYQIVTNPILYTEQVQGIVLLLLDVTEKQQQEQMRREFTANVSHELRTPLTAISGYAEIMMQGLVPAEHMQHFSETIYKEANRLIDLIADIIQLSQLDEAAEQFLWEQVEVSRLAEEVAARFVQKAEVEHVALSVYTEPATMLAIPQVIQEILYNLCDNAIKYNKPEGTVKLSVVQSNGFVVMKVADSGIGIALEDQPRVFERFYRADKSHSSCISGTGLGLSIVKHGVQLHHGELQLESQLGIGTAITVRLPVK